MNIRDTELITALVDNEINDQLEIERLQKIIAADSNLGFDYKVQTLMKNLVRERFSNQKCPDYVRSSIISQLKPVPKPVKRKASLFEMIFSKPVLSYAGAAVIIIALALIIFNRFSRIDFKDFVSEQSGNDNMFLQAKLNYSKIVEGKLAPQFLSDNPRDINNFFYNSGVTYQTSIPEFKDWKIIGAVVSEDKGQKFAHHVYSDQNGQLIYLFQVDESYIYNEDVLKLSKDLVQFLDQGNCYDSRTDSMNTVMTKSGNNVFAVVSSLSCDELLAHFCAR
jgi:hypothetical protein